MSRIDRAGIAGLRARSAINYPSMVSIVGVISKLVRT
jgi:hypothetical protein